MFIVYSNIVSNSNGMLDEKEDVSPGTTGGDGSGQYQWVLIALVIVVCALFAFLYMRYTSSKRQRENAEEAALIQEGNARLQTEFFRADGSMNPVPFVFSANNAARNAAEEDTGAKTKKKNSHAEQNNGSSVPNMGSKKSKLSSESSNQTENGETDSNEDGKDDSDEDSEDDNENTGNVVQQVVGSLKSGKLLRTINRFSVRTSQISKRLADRQSTEEKEESERLNRLADEAVNPLFERKLAKLQKEKAEKEQLQMNVARRHAGALALFEKQQSGPSEKEKKISERYDNNDDDDDEDEDRDVEDKIKNANATTSAASTSGIYKFNDKQLEALSSVMAAPDAPLTETTSCTS